MVKLQYFGHLMWKANSLEETMILGKIEGQRRGQQRMRWLDSTTDSMDMNLSKLWKTVKHRYARCAAVYEVTKSQTRLSKRTTNWTSLKLKTSLEKNIIKKWKCKDLSWLVQWLRLCVPNAGSLGSVPGQGTRSHRSQLRFRMPQLRLSAVK